MDVGVDRGTGRGPRAGRRGQTSGTADPDEDDDHDSTPAPPPDVDLVRPPPRRPRGDRGLGPAVPKRQAHEPRAAGRVAPARAPGPRPHSLAVAPGAAEHRERPRPPARRGGPDQAPPQSLRRAHGVRTGAPGGGSERRGRRVRLVRSRRPVGTHDAEGAGVPARGAPGAEDSTAAGATPGRPGDLCRYHPRSARHARLRRPATTRPHRARAGDGRGRPRRHPFRDPSAGSAAGHHQPFGVNTISLAFQRCSGTTTAGATCRCWPS